MGRKSQCLKTSIPPFELLSKVGRTELNCCQLTELQHNWSTLNALEWVVVAGGGRGVSDVEHGIVLFGKQKLLR